ncbi:MAG: hypothetical protein WC356_02765 [Candidatus Micrarchaeia archaeon]|jgi:hypothetical protein
MENLETEQTGANTEELANQQQDAGIADVAGQQAQAEQGEIIDAQVASEQKQDEVPLHLQPRFQEVITQKNEAIAKAQAEAEARTRAEQTVMLLQQQILAGQQMAAQGQQNAAQQQPQQMQGYYQKLGLEPGDPVTAEQMQQINAMQQQDFMIAMQTQMFLARNPDFNDLVGRANPVTRNIEVSEPLKKVIQNNPELKGLEILALQNPAMAQVAYQLAKMQKENDELRTSSGANDEFIKQQKIREKTGVVSSQAAGGGTGSSIENQIAGLDPNDPKIDQLAARMRSGEFDRQ